MYKKNLAIIVASLFLSSNVFSCDADYSDENEINNFRLKLQKNLASKKITNYLFNFIETFPKINIVNQPIKFNFPLTYSDNSEMINLSAFTKDYYTFSYLKPICINTIKYMEYRQFSMERDLFIIFNSFFRTLNQTIDLNSFDTPQNRITQSIELLKKSQSLIKNGFILKEGQESQWRYVFRVKNYITNTLFPTPIDAHLIMNNKTNKPIILASRIFTVNSMHEKIKSNVLSNKPEI